MLGEFDFQLDQWDCIKMSMAWAGGVIALSAFALKTADIKQRVYACKACQVCQAVKHSKPVLNKNRQRPAGLGK